MGGGGEKPQNEVSSLVHGPIAVTSQTGDSRHATRPSWVRGVPSIFDSLDDLIHPESITRCQCDHSLKLGVAKLERSLFDLSCKGRPTERLEG